MKHCLAVLAILFFVISMRGLSAKNLPGAESICTITIPDDWVVSTDKTGIGHVATATNLTSSETIGLFINPSRSKSVDALSRDPSAAKFLAKSHQTQGWILASQQQRTVNGINFFVLTGTQKSGSSTVHFAIWLTIADGQMFEIVLDDINADPDKSADLKAIINSFSLVKK